MFHSRFSKILVFLSFLVVVSLLVLLPAQQQIGGGKNPKEKTYGGLVSSTGSTVNTSGTPIKIDGGHGVLGVEAFFDEPVDGRLRYTGEDTLAFSVTVHFSSVVNVANTVLSIYIAKNGAIITNSEMLRNVGSASGFSVLSTGYLVSLATNDYIEVFLDSSNGDPTVTTGRLLFKVYSID